ncbi:hypothetical protein [Gymnodinialimonas ulvae]|uniref:hypothetical protein n=1 Tax=Gymnodinialimonas ulvae TaxID=3126504 RepID=UPI0030B4AF3E
MIKRIEPGLFARLMKMSSEPRRDLLEFLGETPVETDDIVPRRPGGDDAEPAAMNPSER